MTLHRQTNWFMLAAGVAVAVCLLLTLYASAQVRQASGQAAQAELAARAAGQLSYLAMETVLYRQPRTALQWRARTDSFVKLLTDLDLFETREANFTPRNPDGSAGAPQKLAEYFAVSEEKLKALPAEKLVELRDNGALGQIYAHLVSLLGWDRLIALAFQRAAQMPTAANA